MDIQKAINAIDAVTRAGINGKIDTPFIDGLIYGKFDRELYQHILDKWKRAEGDYFDFYLSTMDEVKRWMLEALGVTVEPDKYPDYDSRIMAQLRDGKKNFEIYPFETEIVNSFFLFGYNHSLQALQEVSPSAWQTVQENGIDLYGNYHNWSVFWIKASREDKEALLEHVLDQL